MEKNPSQLKSPKSPKTVITETIQTKAIDGFNLIVWTIPATTLANLKTKDFSDAGIAKNPILKAALAYGAAVVGGFDDKEARTIASFTAFEGRRVAAIMGASSKTTRPAETAKTGTKSAQAVATV